MSKIPVSGEGPIILVDDDPIFHDIFDLFYEFSGVPNEKISVYSGRECLELLDGKFAKSGILPAVVLMDINMPEINGIETVQKIRSREAFKTLPIVAMLTSSTAPADIAESRNAGANVYLSKPESMADITFVLMDGDQPSGLC